MRKAKRYSAPPAKKITISIQHSVWGQARSLTISRLTAGVIVFSLTLLLGTAGYFTYRYLDFSYDRAHIAEIKSRNAEQEQQVNAMTAKINELKTRQQQITEEHNKLKKIMGFDPERPLSKASPSRGGQGGGATEAEAPALPEGFAAVAGELSEELSITNWESTALHKLWEHDPDRFLRLPVEYPVAIAKVASDFGTRSNPFRSSRKEVHHGVDFSGDVGTDVYAAGKGTVIFAGWDATYGRLIKIDHGNGLVSWYGHNYRLQVKKGQQVERGEVIALMGSSGRSTGPHVHFAIYQNGEFISPWNYLP